MTVHDTRPRRATPADPMPGAGPDLSFLDAELRQIPPELGQDALAVLDGRSFMYSDPVGDVPEGSIGGLVVADTRLLDKWTLTVNDARLLNLRSGIVEHYHAAFFLTNPDMPDLPANTIGVRRQRVMGGGMRERMTRYGYRDEANRISMALTDAASYSDHRLPEAFSGYDRGYGSFPIPYPTACSPQAWATGAPLLFLRSMLGLEPVARELTVDPDLPDEIGRVAIKGLKAFGTRWDIEATGRRGYVRLAR